MRSLLQFLVLLLLIFALSTCLSCVRTLHPTFSMPGMGNDSVEVLRNYRTPEIDGCQYIYTRKAITHKGNCKNPFHSDARWGEMPLLYKAIKH